MSAAMAKSYGVWQEERYLLAAKKSLAFVRDYLTYPDGSLAVRWRDGEKSGRGFLDDYAYYGWALICMYESTFETKYLSQAVQVARMLEERFLDSEKGGCYFKDKAAADLLYNPKEWYDGAMPAGNSVTALLLVKLARLTGETIWQERAYRQLCAVYANNQSATGRSFFLLALQQQLYPTQELVVVGEAAVVTSLRQWLGKQYYPQLTVIVKTPENAQNLAEIAPFTEAFAIEKETRYYLCQNFACQKPVTSLEEISEMLKR